VVSAEELQDATLAATRDMYAAIVDRVADIKI
jgi:hypothetical protein